MIPGFYGLSGTLALGINAPTRTVVFCGDSPYLTALMVCIDILNLDFAAKLHIFQVPSMCRSCRSSWIRSERQCGVLWRTNRPCTPAGLVEAPDSRGKLSCHSNDDSPIVQFIGWFKQLRFCCSCCTKPSFSASYHPYFRYWTGPSFAPPTI